MLSSVEHEKSFIAWEPGVTFFLLIFQIDLSSNEFQGLLANLNSCFEEENLSILDTKLIGNEKIAEKEELIVTGLGLHMIQKLVGKAQVCSNKPDHTCPCASLDPQGVCPERVPLFEGLMYIGKVLAF